MNKLDMFQIKFLYPMDEDMKYPTMMHQLLYLPLAKLSPCKQVHDGCVFPAYLTDKDGRCVRLKTRFDVASIMRGNREYTIHGKGIMIHPVRGTDENIYLYVEPTYLTGEDFPSLRKTADTIEHLAEEGRIPVA